jgi:hypothetical protein
MAGPGRLAQPVQRPANAPFLIEKYKKKISTICTKPNRGLEQAITRQNIFF